jgi:DNA polymerase III epsilon subunit-like protein
MFDYHSRDSCKSIQFLRDAGIFTFEKTSMVEVANHFGIDTMGAHDAYTDCLITLKIYKKLIELVKAL